MRVHAFWAGLALWDAAHSMAAPEAPRYESGTLRDRIDAAEHRLAASMTSARSQRFTSTLDGLASADKDVRQPGSATAQGRQPASAPHRRARVPAARRSRRAATPRSAAVERVQAKCLGKLPAPPIAVSHCPQSPRPHPLCDDARVRGLAPTQYWSALQRNGSAVAQDQTHAFRDAAQATRRFCRARSSDVPQQQSWLRIDKQTRRTMSRKARLERHLIAKPDRPGRHVGGGAVSDQASIDHIAFGPVDVSQPPGLLCVEDARATLETFLCSRDPVTFSPVQALMETATRIDYFSLDVAFESPGAMQFDPVLLETARAIYLRSQGQAFTADRSVDIDQGNKAFEKLVLDDFNVRGEDEALLPGPDRANRCDATWFDGIAIRGAFGQTVDSIARDYAKTHSGEDIAPRLRRRFALLKENTDYVIGTPYQSLATTVERYGAQLGLRVDGLSDPACLIERFAGLGNAALADATPHTAFHTASDTASNITSNSTRHVSAKTYAAMHLAKSSGVLFASPLSADEKLSEYVLNTLLHASTSAEYSQAAQPDNKRSGAVPAPPPADSQTSRRCGGRTQSVAMSFPWHELPLYANGTYTGDLTPVEEKAIELFRKTKEGGRVWIVEDLAGLHAKLIEHLYNRLDAYRSVPKFDAALGALARMHTFFGGPVCNLLDQRRFAAPRSALTVGSTVGVDMVHHSWLDEFFIRAAEVGGERLLESNGRKLSARDALQQAREAFEEALYKNPVVIAKWREIALLAGELNSVEQVRVTRQRLEAELRQMHQHGTNETRSGISRFLSAMDMNQGVEIVIRSVIETLIYGDTRQRLRLLPIVGSVYELIEGFRRDDGNLTDAGTVHLAEDLLFLWVGSAGQAMMETRIGTAAESRIARLSDAPVHAFAAPAQADSEFLLSMTRDAPRKPASGGEIEALTGNEIDPDAEVEAFEMANAHALADAMPGAPVVAESRADIASAGNAVEGGEADDEVGEAMTHSLSYAEPADVEVGSPGFVRRFQSHWTKPQILGLRVTVWDGRLLLENVRRSLLEPGVKALRVKNIGLFLEARDSASAEIVSMLDSLKKRSPTLRNLFAHAVHFLEDDEEKWVIRRSAEPPSTSYVDRIINVPDKKTLEQMTYVGPEGAVPSKLEEVALHEFTHAATLGSDNVGSQAAMHRGAIVAITDQILFECGYHYPPRLAYAGYPTMLKQSGSSFVSRLIDNVHATARENFELDPLFISDGLMKLESVRILGVKPARRSTIVELNRVMDHLTDSRMLFHSFERGLHADTGRMPNSLECVDFERAGVARTFARFKSAIEDLHAACPLFRHMVGRAFPKKASPQQTAWSVSVVPAEQGGADRAWRVLHDERRIELFDGPYYYASRTGAREVSWHRRAAGVLIDITFGPSKAALVEAQYNRGSAVYLESVMLEELGKPHQRVNALMTRDPVELRADLITAAKATAAEDAYLLGSLEQ